MPELDLSLDAETFDGCETIVISRTSPALAQTALALCRPLSLREIETGGGAFAQGDVKFLFPSEGTTFAPEIGDTIVDGEAASWDVAFVELLVLDTRYSCWCQRS